MTKVLILTEGQTEERFVKSTLSQYFKQNNIVLIPTILATKVVKDGPNFKGGITKYSKVKDHVQRLLKDSSASLVTTLLDYYGLSSDFPGFSERNTDLGIHNNAKVMEQRFREDVGDKRFYPYFQLHEFEALLFSSPSVLDTTIPSDSSRLDKIQDICSEFNNPEEINNGPTTHPSQRISSLYPRYKKGIFGPIVATRIGVTTLCAKCPHFSEWITMLMSL